MIRTPTSLTSTVPMAPLQPPAKVQALLPDPADSVVLVAVVAVVVAADAVAVPVAVLPAPPAVTETSNRCGSCGGPRRLRGPSSFMLENSIVDTNRNTFLTPKGGSQAMRRSIWIAFGTLCILLSSSWLLPAAATEESSIAQQVCFYAAIGLVAGLFSYRQLWARLKTQESSLLRVAGVSVLLLGLPTVLGEWVSDGISDISRAALFALVPFVVVVVAMGRELEPGVRRFFASGLTGFCGALFLLPFSFPASVRGRTMLGVLLVTILLVGFASESIYRLLRGFGMMETVAVVCLSNALFLVACHFAGVPFVENWGGLSSLISVHSLYSLAELLLLVWLLREMSPVRLAARYLAVPLLTVLEGLAFLRPALTVRMGAGFVLLAGGVGYILFSRGGDSDAVLSIR